MDTANGLVDLSLFASSPTSDHYFDHHFPTPEAPHVPEVSHIPEVSAYQQMNAQMPWTRPITRSRSAPQPSLTMKPLPPLPRERRIGSRCILNRMKRRMPNYTADEQRSPLQLRRNMSACPHLTLTVPETPREHANSRRGHGHSPMIWMPDEQMWLISTDNDIDSHYSTQHASPPWYSPSMYTPETHYPHSEPCYDRDESDSSPVRSQFASLIRPQGADRLSPLFQEAISSVTIRADGTQSPPPEYQSGREWPSESQLWSSPELTRLEGRERLSDSQLWSSPEIPRLEGPSRDDGWQSLSRPGGHSRDDSWHSISSGISGLSDDLMSPFDQTSWGYVAARIGRPASALR
ncbi:hypothetical protein MMC20_000631 [Loxospora ochrophaea]|nr:hypothetical protein [Loxospora ochrophaea]